MIRRNSERIQPLRPFSNCWTDREKKIDGPVQDATLPELSRSFEWQIPAIKLL
jgi:hypothetical protein